MIIDTGDPGIYQSYVPVNINDLLLTLMLVGLLGLLLAEFVLNSQFNCVLFRACVKVSLNAWTRDHTTASSSPIS